jgi:hypothetical protein
MTERAIDSQSDFPASEPLENQGLQEPKTDITKVAPYWEEVNPATWKLTDGTGTNTPASYGKWPAFRSTKAIAWVIGICNGLWLVRYRDKASRLMKLPAARKYALEMVKGVRPGVIVDDPVTHLNKITAGAMNARDSGPCPPVEPELLDYIREVEIGGPLDE